VKGRLTGIRILLLPLLLLALTAPAWACLWYYGKNVKGDEVSVGGPGGNPKWFMRFLIHQPEHDRALEIDTSTEPGPEADFKIRSDYAATLVHQGKAAKAIPILEAIEKTRPNEYVIAVNLGTAYELNGENENALRWIREGLRRNSDSHGGTEWLHVLILEAKIAASKDPKWPNTHTVLGLDFGSGDVPVMPERFPSGQSGVTVRKALIYQLHERLAFVHPPDPLVAGMIADLADLEGILETADHAAALYDLALTYRPAHPDLLLRRKAQALKFVGQIVSQQQRDERRLTLASGVVGLLILGAVIHRVVRKRRKAGVSPPSGP
jgi:tetratricopeptide (TPR) repeat protein